MCGIGAIVRRSSAANLGAIRQMMDRVSHRGPDGAGFAFLAMDGSVRAGYAEATGAKGSFDAFIDDGSAVGTVALGHRRLAIIDTSDAGLQPMKSADSVSWIVFNGEIYNYLELRAELSVLGHQFRTGTDTEVILAAYQQWGRDCLRKLDGMFAFGILDRRRKELFLARDRFGVKPLYYRILDAETILVGSEIKQLVGPPFEVPAPNPQLAYDFLAWGVLAHTEGTMFAGVYQLLPGHWSTIDIGGNAGRWAPGAKLESRQWYALIGQHWEGDIEAAAAQFLRLFERSIETHLRSDVPVGSCLSGGMDSSAIVCSVAKTLRRHGKREIQRTFTASSGEAVADETTFARLVGEEIGVTDAYTCPDVDDLLTHLGRLARIHDEPFGSASIYAQWCVFRLAAQHGTKVMLDGQGADESLGGYSVFHATQLAEFVRTGRFGKALVMLIAGTQRSPRDASAWVQQAIDYLLPRSVRNVARVAVGRNVAVPRWLNVARLGAYPLEPFQEDGRQGGVRALSVAQLTSRNLPMLLQWEDRNSMAHSVEARVPYLDHRLVEFVVGLPDEMKVANAETKRVLRLAMRGLVPDRVIDRTTKLGFATAEASWMTVERPGAFRELVREAVERSRGILRDSAIKQCDDVIAGRRRFSGMPWRIISYGQWLGAFY